MQAPTYKPVYMTDETIAGYVRDAAGNAKETTWQVNPQYCLSQESAEDLLALLQDAYPQYTISAASMDPEAFSPASPFHFNMTVPWISITDPSTGNVYNLNAGQFSDYWASASMAAQGQYRDPEVAWQNAQKDIAVGLGGN